MSKGIQFPRDVTLGRWVSVARHFEGTYGLYGLQCPSELRNTLSNDTASRQDTRILSNTSVSYRTTSLPSCVRALVCVCVPYRLLI
jgi:hypothetical protein